MYLLLFYVAPIEIDAQNGSCLFTAVLLIYILFTHGHVIVICYFHAF